MATINLTKGGFERRIASLETMQSGIWNFLGGKPAVHFGHRLSVANLLFLSCFYHYL